MRRLTSIIAALALWSGSVLTAPGSSQSPVQMLYATVTDGQKAPVLDLTASDFVVKEDGRDCVVSSVERASQPMHIALLIDDSGTGIFHFGLNGLGELLQDRAQLSLGIITNQVQKVFDYTPDSRVWRAGFERTGVRPATPEGGQLLEGIFTSAKELRRREARRPVIIALTVGGEEQSPLPASQVLDELRKSRASLHVVYVNSPTVRPARPAGRPADLLEGNFNLSRVLGDGPRESGGRNREVLAMNAVSVAVHQVARDLLSQYAITYTPAPGRSSPQRVQVAVRRSGVTVLAPSRAPSR
jgi:VWFA-related protein